MTTLMLAPTGRCTDFPAAEFASMKTLKTFFEDFHAHQPLRAEKFAAVTVQEWLLHLCDNPKLGLSAWCAQSECGRERRRCRCGTIQPTEEQPYADLARWHFRKDDLTQMAQPLQEGTVVLAGYMTTYTLEYIG